MNRIFISGPHGSGKTTLGKLLAEKLGWEHVGEAARSVIDKVGNPKDMDWPNRLSFQEEVHKAQRKVERRNYVYLDDDDDLPGRVIDRSMLDIAAYLEWFYEDAPVAEREESFAKYANLRLKILGDFYLSDGDLLVILPPLHKVEDDGVRFIDGVDFIHEQIRNDYFRMSDQQNDLYKRSMLIDEPGTTEEYLKKVLDRLLKK